MSLLCLVNLAELHYHFGLIGLDEYEERCRVAEWLFDGSDQDTDPRSRDGNEPAREGEAELTPSDTAVAVQRSASNNPQDPNHLSFSFLGWVFTKADPDPYPSTPHGHWKDQNNKWPKLDPYNGRAFRAKHNEDTAMRLKKPQMKVLWSDERFKDFCRGHLVWYMEAQPHHVFRVGRDRIFKFPVW